MAWKPKTIVGKILKGAVIGGGSLLGLATGFGAVGGVVKGVGALKGASSGIGGLTKVFDKVGQGAVNLITGTNKDERQQVNEIKKDARAAQDKIEQVERLVRAGATEAKARMMVGLDSEELTSFQGKPITEGGMFSNPIVKYGAIAVGIFALAKILKIIK